jgi:amidase
VHSLKDIIDFNEKNAAKEMPYFGQDVMIKAQAKGPLSSPAYLKALKKNHELTRRQGIDAVISKHKLHALIAPTAPPAWFIDHATGDHSAGGEFTGPAAVAGYPHITVPAGFVFGLPVGLSFVGLAYSEPVLIRLAYAYEQATKHRRPPRFLPSADLPR